MRKSALMLALIAVILTVMIVAIGCEKTPAPNTETVNPTDQTQQTSRVINVLTNRIDLIETGVMQKYGEQFAERHPGVKVQFEGVPNYATDIMVRLSTRNLGDVLLLPNNLPNEALPQYFKPLNDELFENIRFADYKAHGGQRYGISSGSSTSGIVYNKAAFEKAGIDEIPTTLEQFYEACEKLKQAGIVPVYLNYGAQWPLTMWSEDLVGYMAGDANYLSSMVDSDEPWTIDNAWGQAITIVKTLIDNGYVESQLVKNQWEASKTELAEGRAAMYLMGNWVINQLIAVGAEPENIGFFPFPYDNEAKRYAPLSPDWFVGVSKFSENSELAEEWVRFFIHESTYIDDSGFLPVDESKQPSLPQFQEFVSFDIEFLERGIPSDRLLEISNSAQIELWAGQYIQEWLAAPDLKAIFDQYNKRWEAARTITES